MLEIQKTSARKLLLLPKSYNITNLDSIVGEVIRKNSVFNKQYQLEVIIQPILMSMEEEGLLISKGWFDTEAEKHEIIMNEIIEELNGYVGVDYEDLIDFNEILKSTGLYQVKTSEDLANYKELHPIYDLISRYQKQVRFHKQWCTRLLEEGEDYGNTVRIKGTWKSFSSYTGRITAKQLPLTSIPRKMRKYVVAESNGKIESFDFSNAELRFLAHYSKCGALEESFLNGEDVHLEHAKGIADIIATNHDIEVEILRDCAKEFVFKYLYGAGNKALLDSLQDYYPFATSFDVSLIQKQLEKQYPEAVIFLEKQENNGFLTTPFGTVKPIAQFNKNQKRNFLLQSSVSVAIKLLMIAINDFFPISHVIFDEIWIRAPTKAINSNTQKKIDSRFSQMIESIWAGFPMKNFIKSNIRKEKIK